MASVVECYWSTELGTYLVLDDPVRIVFSHVAARSNGLVIWCLVSIRHRGSIEFLRVGYFCCKAISMLEIECEMERRMLTLALPFYTLIGL